MSDSAVLAQRICKGATMLFEAEQKQAAITREQEDAYVRLDALAAAYCRATDNPSIHWDEEIACSA